MESNIVVFRYGYTRDGLHVEAVKDILSSTVNSLIKSQDYLNQTFKDGLVGKCVVQTTSTIEDKKELAKVQNKTAFLLDYGFNADNISVSEETVGKVIAGSVGVIITIGIIVSLSYLFIIGKKSYAVGDKVNGIEDKFKDK